MAAKLSLAPACACGKDDWERAQGVINASSPKCGGAGKERHSSRLCPYDTNQQSFMFQKSS